MSCCSGEKLCLHCFFIYQAYEEAKKRHQVAEKDKKKLVCTNCWRMIYGTNTLM